MEMEAPSDRLLASALRLEMWSTIVYATLSCYASGSTKTCCVLFTFLWGSSKVTATWHHTIANYTHADLQLLDKVAISYVRKSRLDSGIELVVPFIFFVDDNKHYSSESLRTREGNSWDTEKIWNQ